MAGDGWLKWTVPSELMICIELNVMNIREVTNLMHQILPFDAPNFKHHVMLPSQKRDLIMQLLAPFCCIQPTIYPVKNFEDNTQVPMRPRPIFWELSMPLYQWIKLAIKLEECRLKMNTQIIYIQATPQFYENRSCSMAWKTIATNWWESPLYKLNKRN